MFVVGLDFQEELGKVCGNHIADRVLEGAHVHPVQRLSVSREVPLDVAQFDVRPRVAQATRALDGANVRTVQRLNVCRTMVRT